MIGNHVDGAKLSQGFESLTLRSKFTWPVGQAVKTPPFHGGNTGSSPVRVIVLLRRITQVRLKGTVLKTVRRVKPCKGSNPLSSFFILSRDGAVW